MRYHGGAARSCSSFADLTPKKSSDLRLYVYQPIFKKSKTDPAAGIVMEALAVLPSNTCGAHETFHDWSIPPYTVAFVVPSVSVGVSVSVSICVSRAFLRVKSAES
jgi:hypothetical protein